MGIYVFDNGFVRASKSNVINLMVTQKDFVSLVCRLIVDVACMCCGLEVELFVLKDGIDMFLSANTIFEMSLEGMLDR
jgi:hypothetical protein